MRVLAATVMMLALSACAEVTHFNTPDGRPFYYVDCENRLNLFESCAAAARRTCPGGYHPANYAVDAPREKDPGEARCETENDRREEQGQPRLACLAHRRSEGFFACN